MNFGYMQKDLRFSKDMISGDLFETKIIFPIFIPMFLSYYLHIKNTAQKMVYYL